MGVNKLGIIGLVKIDKLITTNLELDDLKELVIVNKYLNSIIR